MVKPYLSRVRPPESGSRLRPRVRSRFEPSPLLPIDGPTAGSPGLSLPPPEHAPAGPGSGPDEQAVGLAGAGGMAGREPHIAQAPQTTHTPVAGQSAGFLRTPAGRDPARAQAGLDARGDADTAPGMPDTSGRPATLAELNTPGHGPPPPSRAAGPGAGLAPRGATPPQVAGEAGGPGLPGPVPARSGRRRRSPAREAAGRAAAAGAAVAGAGGAAGTRAVAGTPVTGVIYVAAVTQVVERRAARRSRVPGPNRRPRRGLFGAGPRRGRPRRTGGRRAPPPSRAGGPARPARRLALPGLALPGAGSRQRRGPFRRAARRPRPRRPAPSPGYGGNRMLPRGPSHAGPAARLAGGRRAGAGAGGGKLAERCWRGAGGPAGARPGGRAGGDRDDRPDRGPAPAADDAPARPQAPRPRAPSLGDYLAARARAKGQPE